MRLCRDCRYFSKTGLFPNCHHPSNLGLDYINGGERPKHRPEYMREESDRCGLDAVLFEPKTVQEESAE